MVYEVTLEPGWDSSIDKDGSILVNWKFGQSKAYPIQPYGIFFLPSSKTIQQAGTTISAFVLHIENSARLYYLGFRVFNPSDPEVTVNYGKRQVIYSPGWLIVLEDDTDQGSRTYLLTDIERQVQFKILIDSSGSSYSITDLGNHTIITSEQDKLILKHQNSSSTDSVLQLDVKGVQADGQYLLLKPLYDKLSKTFTTDLTTVLTAIVTDLSTLFGGTAPSSASLTAFTTLMNANYPLTPPPDTYYSNKS